MPNVLQIKRSTTWDTDADPGVDEIAYGELAWNNDGRRLWIGRQSTSGGQVTPWEIDRSASATKRGQAGFATADFDLSAVDYDADTGGIVTIKALGVTSAQLAGAIANAKLSNSTVTIGSTSTALGATSTALSGLTGLDSTDANLTIFGSLGDTKILTIGGHAGNVVKIVGNLQVDGTTTTVNSTTLTVDDKNIELGSVDTPTDTTADGGGITLKGATDKTLTWNSSGGLWTLSPGLSVSGAVTASGAVTGSNLAVTNWNSAYNSGATRYTLPTAAATTLGGVKIGSRITVASGVISADVQAGTYSLPTAASNVLGGVKIGARISIASGVISADVQGDNNTTYSYNIASATTKLSLNPSSGSADQIEILGAGAVAIARTSSAVLTITGTNTTYSAGTNMSLSGTTFSSTDTNTTYSAGTNMSLSGTTFSSTNTTYLAGTNVTLTGTTFSSTDTNTTYTSGNGTTLTGTAFSVVGGTGITADTGGVSITNLGVDTAQLAADSVTAAKIGDDEIGNEHIANNAVRNAHINDDEVSYAKIQNVAADERLLGNIAGANSGIQELTNTQVLTFLGTIDGGTDDWS